MHQIKLAIGQFFYSARKYATSYRIISYSIVSSLNYDLANY